MSIPRRSVLYLLALIAIAAVGSFLILRFGRPSAAPPNLAAHPAAAVSQPASVEVPPTSETLIAAALGTAKLTYEDSLLQRVWKVFPSFFSYPTGDQEGSDTLSVLPTPDPDPA